MINRRDVTRGLLAGGASVAAYSLLGPGNIQEAFARKAPQQLYIPPLDEGRLVDGVRIFDLEIKKGMSQFLPGLQTPTLGINANFLGTTLRMRAGDRVRLNVTNNIGEPTTLHWHGLHLPANCDGGPHQTIKEGTTWSPEFEIKQKAATFWYHSHMHHKTGEQVWRGLAGLLIVDDNNSKTLDIPATYGVDDIPLVLQDRSFNSDGTLRYATAMHNTMMGNLGAVLLANGTVGAHFEATTNRLRIRLLNGSNARFWRMGFDDGRAFHQIASDGSFLPHPVKMTRLFLGPGERAEIIVDISDAKPTTLRNFMIPEETDGGGMMMERMLRMRRNSLSKDAGVEFLKIVPALDQKKYRGTSSKLPEKLISLPRLSPTDAVKTRRFVLEMNMGPRVMMGAVDPLTINGNVMDMNRIDEVVKLGDTEVWEITNRSMMPHPFHIHDIQFQILDRNGKPPGPHERGLKDTVVVNRFETVRVIAKFEDYADPDLPYMYHCHILEHEDAGMMGQFTVVA